METKKVGKKGSETNPNKTLPPIAVKPAGEASGTVHRVFSEPDPPKRRELEKK